MKIKSLNRRIALNTVTNLTGYLSSVLVAFFITPYVIRQVGDSGYGLWIVLLAFVGYATMLEFGLQESLTKLVSKYEAAEEFTRINEIYSLSWAFVLLLSLVAAGLLLGIFPRFLHHFVEDPEKLSLARSLLVFLAVDVALILNKVEFAGMLYGFQLYYVKNLVDIVLNLLNPLITFILLGRGYDIYSLAIASIAVNAGSFAVYYILCRRHSRNLRFGVRYFRWGTLKEIFGIGSKIFTSATIQRAARHAQPLVIAWFLPTVYNTFYSIPNRLVQYGTEMLYVLSTGYMPIFSELSARGDFEEIRRVYFRFTRYIVILFYPLIIGLVSYGYDFISFWMGPQYAREGKYVILFLALSLFLTSTQPLLRRMLVGIGKLNVLVTFASALTVLHFFASIFLVRAWGISGLAATSLVFAVLGQLFWWKYAAVHLGVTLSEYLFKCQGPIFLCLGAYFAFAESIKLLAPPTGYLDILWQMSAGAALYFLLIYAFVLQQNERTTISSYLVKAMAAK